MIEYKGQLNLGNDTQAPTNSGGGNGGGDNGGDNGGNDDEPNQN